MQITAENWERLSRLLDEALDLEPPQRAQWLDSLDEQYADLQGILRELLSRSEGVETASFLQHLPEFSKPPSGLAADELIGPYRLIRELGTGGMSTVWLAERADGLLQRKVALKLPLTAWTDRGLAARIASERDILAALEHPNIARLYDAGVDAKQRPFLALEYIDGAPLNVYCAEHALTLRQRLDLFLQIAKAVAFAHARLIVHRDLKPNNILVKNNGEVRLLDFGIARLLRQDLKQALHLTQAGRRALTPHYAAPEQFTDEPITVAADVYSLGVVLYELLTGISPYTPKRNSPGALEDTVLHAVPMPPSKATQLIPARSLQGDLDVIISKALEKSSLQRYASVEAFAADIERHLAGLPIAARPASRWYLMQKFVRRNPLPLGAAAAVLIALSVGLGTAAWQWREAAKQRAAAVELLANTEATLDFTRAVLTEGIRSDESITINDLLSRSEAIVEELGKNDARVRVVAADFVAEWYFLNDQFDKAERLLTRTIDSVPAGQNFAGTQSLVCTRAIAWSNLGRTDEALAALKQEIERHKNDAMKSSFCLSDMGVLARDSRDAKGALMYALQALQRADEAGLQSLRDRTVLLADIGGAYSFNDMPDRAQEYYGKAFALLERTGRADSLDAATILNNWGIALQNSGDQLQALGLFEQAISVRQKHSPTGQPDLYDLGNLGNTQRMLAHYPEATAAFETEQQLGERGGNAFGQAYALIGKANIARLQGRFDEAQELLNRGAAKIQEGKIPAGSSSVMSLKTVQGYVWQAQGRLSEAAAAFTEVNDSYAKRNCCGGTRSQALVARARIEETNHQSQAALDDAQQALTLAQRAQGQMPFSSYTGYAWLMLGDLRQAQGQAQEAKQAYTLAAKHLAKTLGEQHPDAQQAHLAMTTLK